METGGTYWRERTLETLKRLGQVERMDENRIIKRGELKLLRGDGLKELKRLSSRDA